MTKSGDERTTNDGKQGDHSEATASQQDTPTDLEQSCRPAGVEQAERRMSSVRVTLSNQPNSRKLEESEGKNGASSPARPQAPFSVNLICTRTTFLVRRDELLVNVLRAIFGTLAVFGVYCALNYISTGDATAIVFSSPIWTSILGYFILGEPLQWIHLLALPASLFGIVLIAHPTLVVPAEYLLAPPPMLKELSASPIVLPADDLDDGPQLGTHFDFEHRWPGIVIAVLTSMAVSVCYIVLKFRKSTPIQTTTFWLSAFMCAFGAILMCFMGTGSPPTSAFHWLLLLANGTLSWLGQSVLQWAFTCEQAGVLSIVRTADVAIAFVLSAIFLDDAIFWTSIAGAAIISGVVASTVLNNWLRSSANQDGLQAPDKQSAT